MDSSWENDWGNYLITHRTPENWRSYGEEAGRLTAANEWDEFRFYRDARDLALTPQAIEEKTEQEAGRLASLKLFGVQMWERYANQTEASPAERKLLIDAFRKAYTGAIETMTSDLIPPKLMKNLDLFCNMVSWMRIDMDRGDGRAADYGLRMGAKKQAPPARKKPSYKPSRMELREYAAEHGRAFMESVWGKYVKRQSEGADLRTSMATYNFHFPSDWDVDEVDATSGAQIFLEAFREVMGEKALELAPAKAWENAYLICSFYDQLLAQSPRKKVKENAPRRGFWGKESRRQATEAVERRTWESETRAKIQKEFEKRAKREGKQKPKMGGRGQEEVQALVIVHLSSLDAYTDYAGSEEGKLLGERITQAILDHAGPVIIVDQDWELGPRPSRPRANLLEAIRQRQDIVWIKFDEAVESWDDFFPKLYAALNELGATSAIIGGVWYDESLHTGCATFVYLTLKERMPVVVDESLVGCE